MGIILNFELLILNFELLLPYIKILFFNYFVNWFASVTVCKRDIQQT